MMNRTEFILATLGLGLFCFLSSKFLPDFLMASSISRKNLIGLGVMCIFLAIFGIVMPYLHLTDSDNLKPKTMEQIVYEPLNEYQYTPVNIPVGTELKIVGFSGGRQNEKENINYYQFLVTNLATGDTIRILTPYISVNYSIGSDSNFLTSPTSYDIKKGVTTAFYQLPDSLKQNMAFQAETTVEGNEMDTASLNTHSTAKEWVVINKTVPLFQNYKYKTTVGVLNFKTMPW